MECKNLTGIKISDSVTGIGYGAFRACSSLADVYYAGTEEELSKISVGSGNTFLTNATIHCRSFWYEDSLTLPANLKEISSEAFYGDTSISDVKIPDGVITIGSRAFAYSSLTTINLPETFIRTR